MQNGSKFIALRATGFAAEVVRFRSPGSSSRDASRSVCSISMGLLRRRALVEDERRQVFTSTLHSLARALRMAGSFAFS